MRCGHSEQDPKHIAKYLLIEDKNLIDMNFLIVSLYTLITMLTCESLYKIREQILVFLCN